MKILGMPGQNAATGPWMDSVLAAIAGGGDECKTLYYDFWNDGTGRPDPPQEIQKVVDFGPDLVVAKSMGTLLTVRALVNQRVAPSRCVLIGMPIGNANPELRAVLGAWHERGIPTLFIQQTDDRTGNFAQLAELVQAIAPNSLREIPGDDHVYSDVDQLATLISEFLDS